MSRDAAGIYLHAPDLAGSEIAREVEAYWTARGADRVERDPYLIPAFDAGRSGVLSISLARVSPAWILVRDSERYTCDWELARVLHEALGVEVLAYCVSESLARVHAMRWRDGELTHEREPVRVRVEALLAELPGVFELLPDARPLDEPIGRGELSYSKVRALTRAATAESEQYWIDVALHATASQIEKMVRIEMQLTPEEAEVVWSALNSALDQAPAEAPAQQTAAPTQAAPVCADRRRLELEEQRADAVVDLAQAYLQHQPRTLGSGYEMVVITTPEHLQRGPSGQSSTRRGVGGYLPDGTPVPLHVARMLACDGATAAAGWRAVPLDSPISCWFARPIIG